MAAKVTIDRSGRVLIPKAVREELRLKAGDKLEVASEAGRITMQRKRSIAKKEQGVWVYQGGDPTTSIPELIEREREKRVRELMG
jgi:AbrB family looped-hinge helix DNA binding protein